MAQIHSFYKAGALVFWEGHRHRIIDAIGSQVLKWRHEDHLQDFATGTGTQPTGWTTTLVEGGAADSDWLVSDTAGILSRITTDSNDNDGVSAQLIGENFELTSGQAFVYCGIQFDINDADQTDILFGLSRTDTAMLTALTDGVYMESLDASASVSTVTEKGSSETQTDSVGTILDATTHFMEFYFDGVTQQVYFYFDGVQTGTIHSTNLPDTEALRFSLEFLTGETTANTLDIRQLRVIQVGL